MGYSSHDIDHLEWISDQSNKALPEGLDPKPSMEIVVGDILITRAGPFDRVGVVAHIDRTRTKLMLSDKLIRLRVKQDQDSRFVSWSLGRDRYQRYLHGTKSGLAEAQVNITQDIIEKGPIVIPQISEQQKIADFLAAIDERIALLRRRHDALQSHKKGMMQRFFSQDLRFTRDDGSEFPDWQEKQLREIAKVYDGTHQTPNYVEIGVPFYSVEHVTANDFSKTRFIEKSVFERENERVCLEQNDILMTRIGDIGTSRIIDWDVSASFYVSLALIKVVRDAVPQFVNQMIKSEIFQRELWKRTIHVAFPKKINLGEIGNCSLHLPHTDEQKKIADFLSGLDKKIDNASAQLHAMRVFKKGLLQRMFV